MTSLVSCCARIVNQNKSLTLLHDREDVTVGYMMSGQLILSGKPFNTFSMARLTILQLRLILTPLFTATHAFILSSYHFFHMICDWGIFFILVTLDLCLLLIHRDLWNSQKWQILISVNRDLDFFYFLRLFFLINYWFVYFYCFV